MLRERRKEGTREWECEGIFNVKLLRFKMTEACESTKNADISQIHCWRLHISYQCAPANPCKPPCSAGVAFPNQDYLPKGVKQEANFD
jgi:hypothetical protein